MLSEETKVKLAEKLNKYIDIPLVGEDSEQILAEKVIDMCLSRFDEDEEIDELKRNIKTTMVDKLNKAVNIPFATERMEARILGKIADFILKDKFEAEAERDDSDDED